jgi:transposase
LEADTERIGEVTALGLDEVLMVRVGPYLRQGYSTQIVDVRQGQLLDVVPGRGSAYPKGWLAEQGPAFQNRIEYGTPRPLRPLPPGVRVDDAEATLVADPFHVSKLANTKLDECRRRVQNETLGPRRR